MLYFIVENILFRVVDIDMEKKIQWKNVIHIAGAFMAWVIGSGFATGQELLQFFSSYGYWSFGVVLINLLGFLVLGYLLMKTGFRYRKDTDFNHFHYYCGRKIGSFYGWLAVGTLAMLLPVLVSGAGATLYEYYGVARPVGSAAMTGLILAAYLIGFERMIRIISSIGPVIIGFSLLVGIITVLTSLDNIPNIPQYTKALEPYQTAPHWILSGLLYLGLNFFPASTYLTQLGLSSSEKDFRYGTMVGSVIIIGSILIMSTAILLHGDATAGLDIPVLYLASRISHLLGGLFSVMLLFGIFSSSSVMMWSVCSRFAHRGKRQNTLIAIGLAIYTYIVSQFSFGKLVGTLYPIVGYVGLYFLAKILIKGIRDRN